MIFSLRVKRLAFDRSPRFSLRIESEPKEGTNETNPRPPFDPLFDSKANQRIEIEETKGVDVHEYAVSFCCGVCFYRAR